MVWQWIIGLFGLATVAVISLVELGKARARIERLEQRSDERLLDAKDSWKISTKNTERIKNLEKKIQPSNPDQE